MSNVGILPLTGGLSAQCSTILVGPAEDDHLQHALSGAALDDHELHGVGLTEVELASPELSAVCPRLAEVGNVHGGGLADDRAGAASYLHRAGSGRRLGGAGGVNPGAASAWPARAPPPEARQRAVVARVGGTPNSVSSASTLSPLFSPCVMWLTASVGGVFRPRPRGAYPTPSEVRGDAEEDVEARRFVHRG